jgi:Arc-like DNA binding domain
MTRKPAQIVGLQLRFSERLRRNIEYAAFRNNRSMNQEIVARLEESFARTKLLDEIKLALLEEREREIRERLWGSPEEREAWKQSALDAALDTIEAHFGKGSIMRLPKNEGDEK